MIVEVEVPEGRSQYNFDMPVVLEADRIVLPAMALAQGGGVAMTFERHTDRKKYFRRIGGQYEGNKWVFPRGKEVALADTLTFIYRQCPSALLPFREAGAKRIEALEERVRELHAEVGTKPERTSMWPGFTFGAAAGTLVASLLMYAV